MTNENTSLEKYTTHLIRKGCERVAKGLCVRGELETEQTATYWPPVPLFLAATSFSFCWAAQSGVLRARSPLLGAGSLYSILSSNKWLQLTEPVCRTGLYNCLTSTCTQFNPSTVKVIPWYLREDAPVIYTGAFLIWQLGRGPICYNFT